jgi:hypothetical protein
MQLMASVRRWPRVSTAKRGHGEVRSRCGAIHLPLDRLQSIDLAIYLAGASRDIYGCHNLF